MLEFDRAKHLLQVVVRTLAVFRAIFEIHRITAVAKSAEERVVPLAFGPDTAAVAAYIASSPTIESYHDRSRPVPDAPTMPAWPDDAVPEAAPEAAPAASWDLQDRRGWIAEAPDDVVSWEEVKAEALKRAGR